MAKHIGNRRKFNKDSEMRIPKPDEFSFTVLNKAVEIYTDFMNNRTGKRFPSRLIKEYFKCSDIKARMLKSAAECKYKARLKGLV